MEMQENTEYSSSMAMILNNILDERYLVKRKDCVKEKKKNFTAHVPSRAHVKATVFCLLLAS